MSQPQKSIPLRFASNAVVPHPQKISAIVVTDRPCCFAYSKALEYAKQQRRSVTTIADIFCGCGTTAFEAKRNGIDFWGCDINPVATLIARTKSRVYQKTRLEKY